MTRDEFIQSVGLLAGTFGKTHYSPGRVESLWNAVKVMPGDWFRRCVDSKIDNCRQAPLPGDFAEDIAQERERQHQIRKRQPPSPVSPSGSCHECKGLGIVMCATRENAAAMKADTEGRVAFAPYAFRCECDTGRSDPRAFPFFNAAAISNGFYRIEVRA